MKSMNHLQTGFIWSLLLLFATTTIAQKHLSLKSPNGKLEVNITVDKSKVTYNVSQEGVAILNNSPLSLTLSDGNAFGKNPKLIGSTSKTINETIKAPVYKRSEIIDNCNELTLKFKGDYQIIFRAYNEGMAYRFVSQLKTPFTVKNEEVVFNLASDQDAYIPYVRHYNGEGEITLKSQFNNSFEAPYTHQRISAWESKRIAFTPLVIGANEGKKIVIGEADLFNYPGMFLYNEGTNSTLKGVFAPYPKDVKQGGHNLLQGEVQSTEDYIAKCSGSTHFPWRMVIVANHDYELADNDMVYKLAKPTQLTDFSWIKPGKVAWDWWNDWNIYGVDFKAGINNETYKYYIDFASKYHIAYVILDEGWSVNLKADLMQVVPEINIEELVAYAKTKNVGLILWAGYYAFDRDLENVCKHYSALGIKGFKVDFMDRDDQQVVEFLQRAAETGAKYHLMLDFHGIYKPTGLQRTYPNVINFEGVNGLEQLKWATSDLDQVTYDVTIPYARMLAGPMDYTQGAMRNATKADFRPVNSEPMSQGTRCHQLAEYVIFESPLNMLCDNPSNYMREEECTQFIAQVPTTWDDTKALNGKIAEYITLARRKGNDWYVGSLNNWNDRTLKLDLSFLGAGNYKAELFKDGVNADRAARDYKKEIIEIPSSRQLEISMASGGGCVMRIYKE